MASARSEGARSIELDRSVERFAWRHSIDDARIQITAPINKEAASLAGYEDIGHMEIFKSQTGAGRVATMLMADQLSNCCECQACCGFQAV